MPDSNKNFKTNIVIKKNRVNLCNMNFKSLKNISWQIKWQFGLDSQLNWQQLIKSFSS